MLTTEKAAEWLKAYGDKIAAVAIDEGGYVRANLANRIDPDKPHKMIVHPIKERLVLKIRVPQISEISRSADVMRLIGRVNYDILLGCIGVDQDGEVMFEINHACQDGEAMDPDEEIFRRLIDATCETVATASRLLLHASMVEAGVPRSVAEKVMETHFAEEPEEKDGESL